MKASELAEWLMQNPDADVRIILQTNWHLELDIKNLDFNSQGMVINTTFPESIKDAIVVRPLLK